MRVRVVLCALAITCTQVEADRVRDVVDALPRVATIKHGRAIVDVRGEVAARQKAEVVRAADQVVADVERRFTRAAAAADPAITLCLLSTDKRFREVASAFGGELPSEWGFYRPDHRIAIANLGVSIGNLRHELVHPLIGDDFPQIPSWLNEGIAALYGTARWRGDRFEFLVNYRLKDLRKAIAANKLPTIAELAQSGPAELYGPAAGTYYAMSRYVLLYVDRQGKLSELYTELRAAKDVAARRAVLVRYVDDKAFVAWAKRLSL